MALDPASMQFLASHEWVARENEQATIGISEFAVSQLSDLTYVELPSVGQTVTAGEQFGEVESVKAASELYSPVTGEVIEVNDALQDDVVLLSDDPFGAGWLIKVNLTSDAGASDLLDWPAYQAHCQSEEQ